MSSVEGPLPKRLLRRDAADNRARLLEAAETVFAQRGANGDVREIARLAGVSTGTLYRHFPSKRALIDAVMADVIDHWVTESVRIARGEDAWAALHGFMEETLRQQAAHRVLLQTFRADHAIASEHDIYRHSIEPVLVDVVARAHAAGALRDGVTADDVALLLLALGRTIELFEDTAPGTWRRGLELVVQGLQR